MQKTSKIASQIETTFPFSINPINNAEFALLEVFNSVGVGSDFLNQIRSIQIWLVPLKSLIPKLFQESIIRSFSWIFSVLAIIKDFDIKTFPLRWVRSHIASTSSLPTPYSLAIRSQHCSNYIISIWPSWWNCRFVQSEQQTKN